MPFGGLLSAGIGAAGNVIGGLIQGNAAARARRQLIEQGRAVAGSINQATGGAISAGYAGNQALINALGQANPLLAQIYGQQTGALAPYMQAGQAGITGLQQFVTGPGARPFTADMMAQYDPGYQFRLQQGQLALERSAAARGGALGGAAGRQLSRYSQDYASNEYQNAFSRYMASQQQRYNMLAGLAGYGQNAVGQFIGAGDVYGGRASQNIMGTGAGLAAGNQYIGNIGLSGAEAAGNVLMGAATGGAAGTIAGGQAMAQGIGGAFGDIGAGVYNYYDPWNQLLRRQLQQPPTPAPTPAPPGYLPSNWGTS